MCLVPKESPEMPFFINHQGQEPCCIWVKETQSSFHLVLPCQNCRAWALWLSSPSLARGGTGTWRQRPGTAKAGFVLWPDSASHCQGTACSGHVPLNTSFGTCSWHWQLQNSMGSCLLRNLPQLPCSPTTAEGPVSLLAGQYSSLATEGPLLHHVEDGALCNPRCASKRLFSGATAYSAEVWHSSFLPWEATEELTQF